MLVRRCRRDSEAVRAPAGGRPRYPGPEDTPGRGGEGARLLEGLEVGRVVGIGEGLPRIAHTPFPCTLGRGGGGAGGGWQVGVGRGRADRAG